VLIVDDDRDNRELFQLVLAEAGYDAIERSNGVDALALLENQTFDLMILDLQMPHLNGVSVLKTLRSNPKYDSMKIVIATANAHMALIEVDALADHVIYKPIDLRAFIRLVERLGRVPSAAGGEGDSP
jgi:CheY-like chemotaxis protein